MTRRRGLSKQHRLARNFRRYLQSLIRRVGLTDGRVTADRHENGLKNVHVEVTQAKRPAGKIRKKYSPDELQFAFKTRVSRLMKNCNFRFGGIEIMVSDGDIYCVNFTISTRFDKQEDLSRFFHS